MKIIYFLSFLFLHTIAQAQNTDKLEVKSWVAIDSSASWKVKDLDAKSFKKFDYRTTINIGYNKGTAVWCIFKIKNTDNNKVTKTWLCLNNNHIDSLLFYEHNRIVNVLGDRTDKLSPFLNVMAHEIVLKPGEEKSYVLRIKKELSYLDFSYYFSNKNKLDKKSTLMIAVISFFLGIIFLLIIFNSILYYISRKRLFFYYILHSVLSTAYIAITTNYAKYIILHDFLYFSEYRIYASFFWFISISAFFSHFLNLKKHAPKSYRTIYILSIVNLLNISITIILLSIKRTDEIKIYMILGYIDMLAVIFILLRMTLLHLKIDKKASVYILLAFLPQIVWSVCFILKLFKIINYEIPVDWLVVISLYESFLFGYLLTRNYMDTFVKNNHLIQEIVVEKEKSLQAITQTQIRERRNIANIIHDNFGSKIAYVLHLLQLKNIAMADEQMKELASEIRETSHQILPKSLDDGALISSLESQITSLNAGLKGTNIELFHYDFPERLNEVWIYDMYLISLEIINNGLKHGQAGSIDIELYQYEEDYLFQFTDDGIGFDTSVTPKGFGLENIEKRVLYYKGSFEISSGPDFGTVIQISIPKNTNTG